MMGIAPMVTLCVLLGLALIVASRRIPARLKIGISVLLVAALGFAAVFYLAFSGGVVWANNRAQVDMVRLVRQEYPNKPFRVVTKSYWQLKTGSYDIGIAFDSDRSTRFTFELRPYNGYAMLWFKPRSDESIDVLTEGPAPGFNAKAWYKAHPMPSFQPS